MSVNPKIKALVVEDEPAISELCSRVLGENGFEVSVVGNGKSAQAMVKEQDFSLLLVDIRLPEINGIEFSVWLREELPDLSRRIIFMTGSVMGEDVMKHMEEYGQPYILKPFRPAELLNAVKSVLEGINYE